jgi:anti-anti-sigma factor
MRTDFRFTCAPPRARLYLVGEFDLSTRDALDVVLGSLRRRGCTRLELDLADVTFIDVCTLAVLDREQRRLREDGGELQVALASRRCQRVTRLVGYHDLLAADTVSPGEGIDVTWPCDEARPPDGARHG